MRGQYYDIVNCGHDYMYVWGSVSCSVHNLVLAMHHKGNN